MQIQLMSVVWQNALSLSYLNLLQWKGSRVPLTSGSKQNTSREQRWGQSYFNCIAVTQPKTCGMNAGETITMSSK